MAYYVATEFKIDNFEALNIKKTGRGQMLFPGDIGHSCTLEEIDRYTTSFTNEDNLKYTLHYARVLPYCRYNSPLAIIFYDEENEIARKVGQDLLFADSKEMIDNPDLAIDYVMKKVDENDHVFFEGIVNLLPLTLAVKEHLLNFALLLEKRKVLENEEMGEINKLISNYSANLSQLLLCYARVYENGTLSFAKDQEYERLHILVGFITEYEKKLARKKSSGPIRVKINKK